MKMHKRQKQFLIILLIMAALFNIIAFLLPIDRSNVFWTAYVFEMVAIGVCFIGVGLAGLGANIEKKKSR